MPGQKPPKEDVRQTEEKNAFRTRRILTGSLEKKYKF